VVVSDAYDNTAMGTDALLNVTPISNGNMAGGLANTAAGTASLYSNTLGMFNTAFGPNSLRSNTWGNYNTAVGISALLSNTTFIGSYNTATGAYAMVWNTTGNHNTGVGFEALYGASNLTSGEGTGSNNTGIGANALYSYSTGSNNVASGFNALYANTTGSINTADGEGALQKNTTGWGNTASGQGALNSNTTGAVNIGLGYQAGSKLTTGSHNIEIGNPGSASDNNMIKIGVEGTQAKTFIAGIYNTSVTGSAVMVNSAGQLGVVVSSERFKTGIEPMGSNTAKLEQLRPVTFKLKTDAKSTVQYGLIAEEVAKVYPELVVRDKNGRIDGVRYDELAPMLLNEVQQQAAEIQDLKQVRLPLDRERRRRSYGSPSRHAKYHFVTETFVSRVLLIRRVEHLDCDALLVARRCGFDNEPSSTRPYLASAFVAIERGGKKQFSHRVAQRSLRVFEPRSHPCPGAYRGPGVRVAALSRSCAIRLLRHVVRRA
jgi:Chaperone of endosialidase